LTIQKQCDEYNASNGSTLTYFEEIKSATRTHYEVIYTQNEVVDHANTQSMFEQIPKLVTKDENLTLMQPFSEVDIFSAIWILEPDKATRPNGFSISFYRFFWDTIKNDLKRMLWFFHCSFHLGGNANFPFISLIPKETNPTSLSHFLPISL